jgi:ribosomal protein S27AE
MVLQPFTDNYEDNSTEAGFQFTFYCDLCQEGYKTKFIESTTYKKGRFFRGIGGAFGAASSMLGGIGRGLERGADILSERFHGMSPDWQREHDHAFELAQNEAKGHFHRCPHCRKWVCENDWNEQEGLCVECAPRQNVEIASARAKKMVEEIGEAAEQTKVFTGKIESKQTLCPRCGKPAGEGKFCNNCGASLKLNVCPRCGAENSAQSRFCGECGNRLL